MPGDMAARVLPVGRPSTAPLCRRAMYSPVCSAVDGAARCSSDGSPGPQELPLRITRATRPPGGRTWQEVFGHPDTSVNRERGKRCRLPQPTTASSGAPTPEPGPTPRVPARGLPLHHAVAPAGPLQKPPPRRERPLERRSYLTKERSRAKRPCFLFGWQSWQSGAPSLTRATTSLPQHRHFLIVRVICLTSLPYLQTGVGMKRTGLSWHIVLPPPGNSPMFFPKKALQGIALCFSISMRQCGDCQKDLCGRL